MPSGVGDYGATTWLQALFGVIPIPTGYWIALTSAQPGAAMDGDMLAAMEPTDSAYVRMAYGTGPTFWASNGNYLTNLQSVAFPVPDVDWGYLSHFALCTAAASGQLYAWGEMLNPQFVSTTIGMFVPAGALVLGLHALDNSIAV